MRKVKIQDSGDTVFLEDQLVHKSDFIDENDIIYGKKLVEDSCYHNYLDILSLILKFFGNIFLCPKTKKS